jgi:hypothetical protein
MLIDKALDLGFGEPEETYSNSDNLYEELDIPREVTGVLPRAQRTRAGLSAEALEDIGETGRHGAGPARGRGATGGSTRGPSGGHGSSSGRRDSAEPAEAAERPARARRGGTRTRTRAGQPADGAPAGTAAPATTAPADGDAPRRRRRRSRGGRGSGAPGAGASGASGAGAADSGPDAG